MKANHFSSNVIGNQWVGLPEEMNVLQVAILDLPRRDGGCGEWPLFLLHAYEVVEWFAQVPNGWRWCLMTKIRSAVLWLKPSPVWVVWAALLLPVAEGIAVPLRPRSDEAT